MKILTKMTLSISALLLASNIALAEGSIQPGTDAWITTKIQTSIVSEKIFGDTNPNMVNVTTKNGMVYLTGTVNSEDNKSLVEQYIKSQNFDGVKGVENKLVVDTSVDN